MTRTLNSNERLFTDYFYLKYLILIFQFQLTTNLSRISSILQDFMYIYAL